jgi:hypothetical protein
MAIPIDQELATAANFEVLAATAVTGQAGTGTSVVGGNVGIYPTAVSAVTNFPPSTVAAPFTIHGPDSASQQAQTDATAAYNFYQALPGGVPIVGNLAGQTFTPGVYKAATSLDLSVGGTVTLNAQGNPNAQFIFQIGSTLTLNNGSTVLLTGGALARNVIWLVGSSSTYGTTAVVKGDTIANTSITVNDNANVTGRLLALNGAVTFSGTTGNTATSPAAAATTSSTASTITLSELCFPDITGKTIKAWGIVTFSPGGYTVGGIPMGLMLFADQRTVDFNGFLRCEVFGEDVVVPLLVGGYQYHYSPVNDALQIFTPAGVELTASQIMPVQVLSDLVLFEATWNRTTVLG